MYEVVLLLLHFIKNKNGLHFGHQDVCNHQGFGPMMKQHSYQGSRFHIGFNRIKYKSAATPVIYEISKSG